MKVINKVLGFKMMDIDDLVVCQEGLKTLSKFEYEKLKNSLLINGLIMPFLIWENLVLDGAQRLFVLRKLMLSGVDVPQKVSCVEIVISGNWQARKFILQYISQHGKISKKGLCEMVSDTDLNFFDIKQEINISASLIKHVDSCLLGLSEEVTGG